MLCARSAHRSRLPARSASTATMPTGQHLSPIYLDSNDMSSGFRTCGARGTSLTITLSPSRQPGCSPTPMLKSMIDHRARTAVTPDGRGALQAIPHVEWIRRVIRLPYEGTYAGMPATPVVARKLFICCSTASVVMRSKLGKAEDHILCQAGSAAATGACSLPLSISAGPEREVVRGHPWVRLTAGGSHDLDGGVSG